MDRTDFDRLYRAEYGLLVRQFRRQYRDLADEVEDVVQEAFDKLWQRCNASDAAGTGRGAAPADPGAWVYRVVSNAMIDRGRSRQRRRTTDIDEIEAVAAGAAQASSDGGHAPRGRPAGGEALEYEPVEHQSPSEDPVERRLDALRYALTRLKPRDRELLEGLYIQGLTYDQLAERSSYSRKSLGTLLLRARRSAMVLVREYLEGGMQVGGISDAGTAP